MSLTERDIADPAMFIPPKKKEGTTRSDSDAVRSPRAALRDGRGRQKARTKDGREGSLG